MWQGRLAQLVERLPYKERVRSSSLLTPTIKYQMTFVIWYFIMRLDDEKLIAIASIGLAPKGA